VINSSNSLFLPKNYKNIKEKRNYQEKKQAMPALSV